MFPFLMRRDGGPELVIRRKHPVVATPVLPRRWDEVRQTIEKLKRREFKNLRQKWVQVFNLHRKRTGRRVPKERIVRSMALAQPFSGR